MFCCQGKALPNQQFITVIWYWNSIVRQTHNKYLNRATMKDFRVVSCGTRFRNRWRPHIKYYCRTSAIIFGLCVLRNWMTKYVGCNQDGEVFLQSNKKLIFVISPPHILQGWWWLTVMHDKWLWSGPAHIDNDQTTHWNCLVATLSSACYSFDIIP